MLTTVNLRCEYAPTPLGIDVVASRLSWEVQAGERAAYQTAYQIQAASSPELLVSDQPDLWDSGTVASAEQLVPYGGAAPQSRQRVVWRVRAWTGMSGASAGTPGPWAAPTWFEMGLLEPDDWHADWIGFPAGWNGRALVFRRPFHLDKPIRRARAYISGLGYYELRLNGAKVGDHVLDPGTTAYDRRILYVTYDVTDALRTGAGLDGENMVGVIVGHGWYGAPKLLLQLEVIHDDGSTTRILSQSGPWQVGTGPIVENSIYDGEVYDARLERPGWDMPVGLGASAPEPGQAAPGPGGNDVEPNRHWSRPHVTDSPGGRLVAQTLPPIRVTETLVPQSVTESGPGVFVYDLGQNIAGWARIRVQGPRGTRVTLRFAESLYPDGTVNQENLRGAAATDVYVLKGQGAEVWEPHFTYHGFRYTQVEGWPGTPEPGAIEGRVVRSDNPGAGRFACSNALLNRIDRLVWWTEATNQHSIPTDCPQRDERMGWLNDLGARTEEAVYNIDVARFFAKWVADIHDAQDPVSGAITDTAPFRWGNRPADPVSVSYLLIPWMLYIHYGDTRTMSEHYDGLRGWVDYLTSRATSHIVAYSYYGDWAPPAGESRGSSAVSANTPGDLISTGYYFYAASLLAQMAEVLGRSQDAIDYSHLAAAIAGAYRARFYDPQTGGYGSNNQACNAFSLYLGLVPDEQVSQVVTNLARDVMELHGGHLTTGNLCTKYLLEVLATHGHADVAYTIATQEAYPSWGYMLANGATTVWERWEHATGGAMNSHNHPMYASIGAWFYRTLVGIVPDPTAPGFARFTVHPRPAGDLTRASATLATVRGAIESAWTLEDDRFTLRVIVPAGSTATIRVPKPGASDGRSSYRILEGAAVVWQPGHTLAPVPGLTATEEEATAIAFTAGSGDYTFIREPLS